MKKIGKKLYIACAGFFYNLNAVRKKNF